jgi:hypothetical protein
VKLSDSKHVEEPSTWQTLHGITHNLKSPTTELI